MADKPLSPMQKFMGFHEILTVKFQTAVFSEFLGTAILIIMGCGGVVSMDEGRSMPTITPAILFGFTVATIVWTLNHRSGAHINPAVSLGFLVTGQLSLAKFLVFTVAQCGGAISGAAVLWVIIPPAWRGTLGSTVYHEEVTLWQGFAIEALSTFFLMLCVVSSGDRLRTDHEGSMPLTIGLCVFVQSAWAGKLTGCSMNPARTLGPALISNSFDHHWVYWVAPCLGSVIGALLYKHVLAETTQMGVDDVSMYLEKVSVGAHKDSSLSHPPLKNHMTSMDPQLEKVKVDTADVMSQDKGIYNLGAELGNSAVKG